jgi:hypothetical protein
MQYVLYYTKVNEMQSTWDYIPHKVIKFLAEILAFSFESMTDRHRLLKGLARSGEAD